MIFDKLLLLFLRVYEFDQWLYSIGGLRSRAEQTRRALAQDVSRFYTQHDIDIGREPQELPPAGAETPGSET